MVAENIAVTPLVKGLWQAGEVYSAYAKITIGSAVETGDTWTLTDMLPSEDIQIVGGNVSGVEMDTNATPTATLVLGDGTDTDGFMASVVAAAPPSGQFNASLGGALVGGASKPASTSPVLTLGGTVATAASSGDVFVRIDYLCRGA
jgi:hypothetical protein